MSKKDDKLANKINQAITIANQNLSSLLHTCYAMGMEQSVVICGVADSLAKLMASMAVGNEMTPEQRQQFFDKTIEGIKGAYEGYQVEMQTIYSEITKDYRETLN